MPVTDKRISGKTCLSKLEITRNNRKITQSQKWRPKKGFTSSFQGEAPFRLSCNPAQARDESDIILLALNRVCNSNFFMLTE